MDELWGDFSEYFGEIWSRYNGTALYLQHIGTKSATVYHKLIYVSRLILVTSILSGPGISNVMWDQHVTFEISIWLRTSACYI